MPADKIITETDIARVAEEFFTRRGWDLYPEVVINGFAGRPDFVGVKNGRLCQVTECKKTLSWPLIEQLSRWQDGNEYREPMIPHLLTAVVGWSPLPQSSVKRKVLEQYGIGVFMIRRRAACGFERGGATNVWSWEGRRLIGDGHVYEIEEALAPKLQPGSRATANRIVSQLYDDMKIAMAGAKGGQTEYMTPFKRTMGAVTDILADGRERHIDHIVDELNIRGGHHYTSDRTAKSCIPGYIEKFGIATKTRDYGAWFQANKTREADDAAVAKLCGGLGF